MYAAPQWILLLAAFSLAEPNKLTYENYDEVTKDKAILVRFVTNW